MSTENHVITRYRTLSSAYDGRYQAHLEDFQRSFEATYPDPEETAFTDFYPVLGVPYDAEVDFLVYGQAVGGWHQAIDMARPVPKDRALDSKDYSNGTYSTDSPLEWVNARWSKGDLARIADVPRRTYYEQKDSEYWASRSFFWQLTTKVIQGYHGITDPNDRSWCEKLVWSNLYKIARQKENPLDDIKVLQRSGAVELVQLELQELRPKVALVLTSDTWWAPFHRGIGSELVRKDVGAWVQRIEALGHTRIIVVRRPFVGDSTAAAQEVLEVLRGS